MGGFLFFVGIGQTLIFFVHYVLFKFYTEQFSIVAKHKYLFGILLFLLSISFCVAMIITRYWQNTYSSLFYKISAIWLGMLLWLFLAVFISVIITNILPIIPSKLVAITTLFIALFINGYGIYHANNIKIVQKSISIKNAPKEWVGKKLIFFADTHYGNIHTKEKARKDAAFIKNLKPDALFMSGDFFDGPMNDLDQFAQNYKDLQPPLGKYFVSGNHETYADLEKSEKALSYADFTILDNEGLIIKDGMQIIGVPYTTNTHSDVDTKTTKDILQLLNTNQPSIVLKHIPIAIDEIALHKPSFAFFGHTHRGQMWPFSLLVKKVYGKYAYGEVINGATTFYTTSGVGSWGPPQRIGTDSEIILVTIYDK